MTKYAANISSPTIISGFESDKIQPFFALEMLLDTQTFREWTGYGNLTLTKTLAPTYSKTFTGTGSLLNFSPVREDAQLSAKHMNIGITGLKASNLNAALAENYQYRKATVYTGCIYDDGSIDHFALFSGWLSDMQVQETGNGGMGIMINIESPLAAMDRANAFHYTAEEQIDLAEEIDGSGEADNALKRIIEIQDLQVTWS